jgi:CRISPR/Cas system-associated protein Cas10 (large subunit of type III CRISPR-Cas system)
MLICQTCHHREPEDDQPIHNGWGPKCPVCGEDDLMTAEKYEEDHGRKCSDCGKHDHDGREVPDPDGESVMVWVCEGCLEEHDSTPEHQRLGLPSQMGEL